MKDSNSIKVNKIEIDETTAEPKIVEVDADIQPIPEVIEQPVAEKTDDFKSEGFQLSMENIYKTDDTDKRKKIFKTVCTVAFIVIVIGVLIFTAIKDFGSGKQLAPAEKIFEVLGQNWYYVIFALIALAFCYFFKGFKLSILCKSLTGKWHFKTCIETGIVGHYYNYITPLAVGGQPFEIYYLSRHGVHGGFAASMPIAAFFGSQLGFTMLGLAAIILLRTNALNIPEEFVTQNVKDIASSVAIIGLVLGLLMPALVCTFSMLPKVGAFLVKITIGFGAKLHIVKDKKKTTYTTLRTVINNAKCLKKVTANPIVFISTTICGFGENLALASIAYFTLRFFGFDLPAGGFTEWMQIIQLCLILQLAVSFFPTPGNSGAADLSFFFLFETGLSKLGGGFAFPAMLVWRFLSYYSFIIIGFIFTTNKKHADKKREKKGIYYD